ncbi:glycosyltransferase family 2 protein [Candidatus Saccharibacteria bacterium]|nr:glycosyltransferase family 2 protein [Candidatus Saccharibacteria bacterium]
MNKPKISVIMPVYNQEELLPRALHSLPLSENYQIILLDDGSTDKSWQIAIDWYDTHRNQIHPSSLIHRWTDNHGVAAAMNLGFSLAEGEYIVSLSSDDYYLTGFFEFEKYLDGKNDLVYFDLEVNDGSVWHVNEKTKNEYVGAVKFIRREFLGDTRVPDHKYKEDSPFSHALYAKNPREAFTGIVLKRYNWPHEGSLSWQATQDYVNDRKLWAKNSGMVQD